MSLSTAVTATPNRVQALLRTCVALGGSVKRADVALLMSPRSLRDDTGEAGDKTGEIVRECRRMGLVDVSGPNIKLTKEGGAAAGDLLAWIRPRLVEPELAASIGQEEFPPLLCWLLMQDPYEHLDRREAPSSSIKDILGPELKKTGETLRNEAVYQQFLYWARFLGFAAWTRADRTTRVLPIPTPALRWAIEVAQFGQSAVAVDAFLAKVAHVCPVFDGGSMREQVEQKSATKTYEPGRSASPSLGLALMTLEASAVVGLASKSDAAVNLALVPASRGRARTISDVMVL